MSIDFDITPTEYELQVKEYLEAYADTVYEFNAQHQEDVPSTDGSFNIDITVRFKCMAVDWFVIIEYKRYSHPVKRDTVISLKGKKDSLHADKAMLFSASGFQSGAIEYANQHRIVLCQFYKENILYFTEYVHQPLLTIDGVNSQGEAIKCYDPKLFELLR